jgi:hypothetical protein
MVTQRRMFSWILVVVATCSLMSEADDPICGSKNFPYLALNPVRCETTAKVFILGERHGDPMAREIRQHTSALGAEQELMVFQEGHNYLSDAKSFLFGLDDPRLGAIASLTVAQRVFQALEVKQPHDSLSSEEELALTLSRAHFLRSFSDLWEAWGDLSWLPSTFQTEPAAKVFQNLKNLSLEDRKFAHHTIESQEWAKLNNFKALNDASLILLGRAVTLLKNNPKYNYINFSQIYSILGDGRNIGFARAILDHYCRAAKQKLNIWVQVGHGHSKGLECLLKAYLPTNVSVEVKTASDYYKHYSSWKEEFREKLAEPLETEIQRLEPDIEMKVAYNSKDLGQGQMPESQVWIYFPRTPSRTSYSRIKTLISEQGYRVLERKSFSNREYTLVWVTTRIDQTHP